MDSLRFVGTGKIEGDLCDIGNYPDAVKRKGIRKIIGDVFLLDDSIMVLNLPNDYKEYSRRKGEDSKFMPLRMEYY
jgi:hypothetical protein